MDDKSSITNVDCPSKLKVACPPPGIGAEKSGKFLTWNRFGMTYIGVGNVALEYGVVDLHIRIPSINSPPLEVACPRQELERNFEIVLFLESARVELKSSAHGMKADTHRIDLVQVSSQPE
jgi:hypothetical protein